MLEVGSLIDGKYKILNKVGQGGMSVVYLAMNERANKQWAVKEVRKDGVLDFESVKQGLVAETDILKKLSHPHLPSIIDVIDTEDSFIIIMDYVQGNSLDKALKEFGAQPQDDVIEWAKQLCDVLGYLHTREPAIIYRDMKPANVMLKPDGSISLIDFGTAREHKASKVEDTTCLGTRGYAAPEQYGGMGQTDARTDIYCLGATIYHLVTGMNPSQPPYEIRPITEIDPTLSTGLEKIILKCTQNNPADRYQSCAELMYDLEHYKDFEDQHIKAQKNKLKLFVASVVMTVVFASVSAFAFFSAEKVKGENYENILAKATTVEEYYDAIVTDPTRPEAYLGSKDYIVIIDFFLEDGVLERSESDHLRAMKLGIDHVGSNDVVTTVKAMEELKDADEELYSDVCFEAGKAFLFYYDIGNERDKYSAAAAWFAECGDRHPESKIYCDISECLTNINKYSAGGASKLKDEYKTMWDKLKTLYTESLNFDDDTKVRVWNEMVGIVNNNCKELCMVTTKDDLKDTLNQISDNASKVNNAFIEDTLNELETGIESTLVKVDSVDNG